MRILWGNRAFLVRKLKGLSGLTYRVSDTEMLVQFQSESLQCWPPLVANDLDIKKPGNQPGLSSTKLAKEITN